MQIKHEYTNNINKSKIIYPELSYEIIGAAFDVFNELGWGHREIYYHRALKEKLNELSLKFDSEKKFKESVRYRRIVNNDKQ